MWWSKEKTLYIYLLMPCTCIPGHGCSNLMTSLVNVSIKFQNCKYPKFANIFCWKNVRSFCSAKASLTFSTKKFIVFGYKVVKHLTSRPLNKLVKLTMLWTTGPRWAKTPIMPEQVTNKYLCPVCCALAFSITVELQWLEHWWLVHHGCFELIL